MDIEVSTEGQRDGGGGTAVPQRTSEQIVAEAYDNRSERLKVHSSRQFLDLEELRFYQQNKRREYEKHLNKNRLNLREWMRYARWEAEENHDVLRARSIFERALEVNIEYVPFWTHYVQFELVHKNINHARNLLDRGVTTLPFVEKLWFLYVQTEEMLRNYSAVRDVFERWLLWNPKPPAWDAYINFEKRYDEFDRARSLFSRYVVAHPNGDTWLRWIDFEADEVPTSPGQVCTIRYVFESAVDHLLAHQKKEALDDAFVILVEKWANWEVSVQEFERARTIYRLLLDDNAQKIHIESATTTQRLRNAFTDFEKRFGSKETIESSVTVKRKAKYEQDLARDPTDYTAWWLYLNILHENRENEALVEAYEKAIVNVPDDDYKSLRWKRFIYIWLRYAFWCEFDRLEVALARSIWNRCIKIIPHKIFTFGKVWIAFAKFEIRNGQENGLSNARKILGRAIGSTILNGPKEKIFRYYLYIETTLSEWDRVRKLYERWMELSLTKEDDNKMLTQVCYEYSQFERKMSEIERSASILVIALSLVAGRGGSFEDLESIFDEVLSIYCEELLFERAKDTFVKLSNISPDPRVWIKNALFQLRIPTHDQLATFESSDKEEIEFQVTELQVENTRAIFSQAVAHYKANDAKKERATILEAWKDFEQAYGTSESVAQVHNKLPQVIQKKRIENGIEEEYEDYIYPDEEPSTQPVQVNKFLENAKKWALQNS